MHTFSEWQNEPRGATERHGRADMTRSSGDGAGDRDGATIDAELRDVARGVLLHAVCAARFAEVADGDDRQLVQRVCSVAKGRGLRAEQLIIGLKDTWCRLPEARRLQHQEADDVLARVITVCIEEYYAPFVRRRQD